MRSILLFFISSLVVFNPVHAQTEREQVNLSDEDAWVNYYTAARMAKIQTDDSDDKEEWQTKMDDVIDRMEKNIPGTYPFYRLKVWRHRVFPLSSKRYRYGCISRGIISVSNGRLLYFRRHRSNSL